MIFTKRLYRKPESNNNMPVCQDTEKRFGISGVVTGRFPVQWMDLGIRHCLVRYYSEPKVIGSIQYTGSGSAYNDSFITFCSL